MPDNEELPLPSEGESKIDLFKGKEIRKVLHEGEWWFVVVDVIASLTGSIDPTGYVKDMRRRDKGLAEGWGQIATPLRIETSKGPQNINCANIEGLFRIMQSVPSPKAEPFKKWLAKSAFERLQEIDNPELAVQRAIALYRAKGYPDGWIDTRIKNKVSREILTKEWFERGVQDMDYAILTDAISIETFGLSTAKHKELKGLKSQSLRDNMTPIELTLTTLGEQSATEITRANNAQGKWQNLTAAKAGGKIAGNARMQLEEATGQTVVSDQSYLTERQRQNNAQIEATINDTLSRILRLPGTDPLEAGEIGTVS
ncbi:MAG TPA: Bro-N domain-containing protein [Candidatus Saccharimonadia bacterium]|nr:Bro-N domain-containing protein [Candidatus Saccharimonadia bacterium]